jgi:TonB family protein
MILARVWMLGMVVVLGAYPVWAQTDARGLEDALKGKQFELRDYSAEPVAHYEWIDGKLVDTPAEVHTLGVFTASGVKLKGQKLSILGVRATLTRDAENNQLGLAAAVQMELDIDLNGADPAVVLPQLRDLLFFPDASSAIASIPGPMARVIAAPLLGGPHAAPCHCERFLRDGAWTEVPAQDPKWKQAKVIHMEQPSYTDAATKAKVNGSVRLLFLVDEKGEPADLWLVIPRGFGLDEAAEQAVRKYRFAPALYDKQPVEVQMAVEVNFSSHGEFFEGAQTER